MQKKLVLGLHANISPLVPVGLVPASYLLVTRLHLCNASQAPFGPNSSPPRDNLTRALGMKNNTGVAQSQVQDAQIVPGGLSAGLPPSPTAAWDWGR